MSYNIAGTSLNAIFKTYTIGEIDVSSNLTGFLINGVDISRMYAGRDTNPANSISLEYTSKYICKNGQDISFFFNKIGATIPLIVTITPDYTAYTGTAKVPSYTTNPPGITVTFNPSFYTAMGSYTYQISQLTSPINYTITKVINNFNIGIYNPQNANVSSAGSGGDVAGIVYYLEIYIKNITASTITYYDSYYGNNQNIVVPASTTYGPTQRSYPPGTVNYSITFQSNNYQTISGSFRF